MRQRRKRDEYMAIAMTLALLLSIAYLLYDPSSFPKGNY